MNIVITGDGSESEIVITGEVGESMVIKCVCSLLCLDEDPGR